MSDQINSAQGSAPAGMTQAQMEQQVAMRYKKLNQEAQMLIQKLIELEDEKKENELVLESISKLEDGRKCWRLVNGVLMEKTKVEVIPEMRLVSNNLSSIINQITDTLQSVRTEIKNLEQAYEHIMNAAKKGAGATAQAGAGAGSSGKPGGVLV